MQQAIFVSAVAAILILSQVGLGYSDSDSDEVRVKARQYNCPYYYMMMNNGSQVMGQNLWLLLGLGITALLFSTDNYTAYLQAKRQNTNI